MKGRALDFFLPDVSVKKLRSLGLRAHAGGVGYYSGSFIHLDTGSIRHWPKMSRRQLAKVFPRGRTVHIPGDGKPMAGYRYAAARIKKRGKKGSATLLASASPSSRSGGSGLLKRIFGGGADETGDREALIASRRSKSKKQTARTKTAASPAKATKPGGPQLPGVITAGVPAGQPEKPVQPKIPVIPRKVATPKLRPNIKLAGAAEVLVASASNGSKESIAGTVASSRFDGTTGTVPVQKPPTKVNGQRFALAATPELTATQKVAEVLAQKSVLPVKRPVFSPADIRPGKSPATEHVKLAMLEPDRKITRQDTTFSQQMPSAIKILKEGFTIPVKAPVRTAYAPVEKPAGTGRVDAAFAALAPSTQQAVSVPKLKPAVHASRSLAKVVPSPRQLNSLMVDKKTARPEANAIKASRITSIYMSPPTLLLGDLDGTAVAAWAVSRSTRTGRSAVLTAPKYFGVLQNVPESIIDRGFDQTAKINRTNRFSGQAIRRIAFAKFVMRNVPRNQAFPTDRF